MFDGTTMSSTGLTNGRHRHSGHEEVGNTCYEVTILRTPGIKTSVSRARLFISHAMPVRIECPYRYSRTTGRVCYTFPATFRNYLLVEAP